MNSFLFKSIYMFKMGTNCKPGHFLVVMTQAKLVSGLYSDFILYHVHNPTSVLFRQLSLVPMFSVLADDVEILRNLH